MHPPTIAPVIAAELSEGAAAPLLVPGVGGGVAPLGAGVPPGVGVVPVVPPGAAVEPGTRVVVVVDAALPLLGEAVVDEASLLLKAPNVDK